MNFYSMDDSVQILRVLPRKDITISVIGREKGQAKTLQTFSSGIRNVLGTG